MKGPQKHAAVALKTEIYSKHFTEILVRVFLGI